MKFSDCVREVGKRFTPTDDTLVAGYLLPKLWGLPLPTHDVTDCDLYGHLEPWQIWSKYGGDDVNGSKVDEERDLYFFTRLKKITEDGKNFDRTIGNNGGKWHGEDSGSHYQTKDGRLKWVVKRFKYRTKEKSKRKRIQAAATDDHRGRETCGEAGVGWILHEYTLNNIGGLNDCVLCRLRRLKKVVNKKKSQRCFAFDCHEVGKKHGSHDIQQEEKKTTATDATADEIEQVVVEEKKTTTNAADDDDSGFLDVIDFSIESLLENNEDEVEQDDIDFITQLESSLENNEDEVEQDDIDFITEIERLLENNDEEMGQLEY
ncbi:NAC transcription factor 32 [Linum perenne]